MRSGRRLAIDVGRVRIGVAASDMHGILASGLATVKRLDPLEGSIMEIQKLIEEIDPIEIYIGLPVKMSGEHSASTQDAISFGLALQKRDVAQIRFIDERLTTVTAANSLRQSGRDSKSGRAIIDQIAATIILEQALEIERKSGIQPGKSIEEIDG